MTYALLLGFLLTGLMEANNFYVSPSGSASGDGSITKPWNLHTALAAPATVKPGDTIWVRGGTYKMAYPTEFWSKLAGNASAPIVVRRYPNEAPVLDLANLASSLFVYGSYTWFWGFEIMSSGIPRSTSLTGPWSILNSSIEIHGPGSKFINCYVHDLSQGLSYWNDSIAAEAYGNIVYHVGWSAPDRGHGHAIYSQNQASTGLRKTFSDNFLAEAFDIGLQMYGSGAALVQDYLVAGNVVWDNGIPMGQNVDQIVIAGGGQTKRNIELDSNVAYNSGNSGYSRIGWQWDGINHDVNIHNNWFVGGYSPLEMWHWDNLTFRNNFVCGTAGSGQALFALYKPANQLPSAYSVDQNQYCGGNNRYWQTTLDPTGSPVILGGSDGSVASFKSQTGWDQNSTFGTRPTQGVNVMVRPNKYEAGRANIVIFNWQPLTSVPVNLSGAGLQNGDSYVIRDVQNFNGAPVASGVYSSSNPTVSVPMAGLAKTQIVGWGSAIPHTGPKFGTFILIGGSALGGGAPPPVVVPTTPDTTAPTVSVNAPATGSGTVTLVAMASDNIGVTSVQFILDGAKLGTAYAYSPSQLAWDTTTATNGNHIISAIASDAAGNQGTATGVTITVNNVVVTGGSTGAVFISQDTTTQGKWSSAYGRDGAMIAANLNTPPSYAQVNFINSPTYVWMPSTTDVRALVTQAGTGIASTWYGPSTLTLDVNLTDGQVHKISLYSMDYDSTARIQRIDVFNAGTGALLDSRSLGGFNGGIYDSWNISGHVQFRVARLAGANSVIEGVFFGPAAGSTPTPTPTGDTTPPTVSFTAPTAGQTLVGTISPLALASDNVGVAGVQFKLDGVNLGAELTAAPFTTSWNTATTSNGAHTLSAVARDAAGNSATATVTVTVSNTTVQPTAGPAPTAYWTLNAADTNGILATDRSGNALNLTIAGTVSTAGRVGEAMQFNGYSSNLQTYAMSKLEFNNSMTFGAWIKTTATRSEAILSKYESSGTEAGYLLKTVNGALAFRLGGKNAGNGSKEFYDTTKINDGAWHHVAVVVTLGQGVQFYVDGVAKLSFPVLTTAGSNGVAFQVGAVGFSYYGAAFSGVIDEVKVFNSALTDAQVAGLASGN